MNYRVIVPKNEKTTKYRDWHIGMLYAIDEGPPLNRVGLFIPIICPHECGGVFGMFDNGALTVKQVDGGFQTAILARPVDNCTLFETRSEAMDFAELAIDALKDGTAEEG